MCVKIVLVLANDLILLTLLIVSIKKEKAPIKYSWKHSQTSVEKDEIGIWEFQFLFCCYVRLSSYFSSRTFTAKVNSWGLNGTHGLAEKCCSVLKKNESGS